MPKLYLIACLSICLLTSLTGCGQTGPLYLPGNSSVKSTTTGQ